LLSRGLSEYEARTLLVEGFFEAELSAIEDDDIKNTIRNSVVSFLSHAKNEK
jgi:Fe-S cluster assembly scaffold protein SufB